MRLPGFTAEQSIGASRVAYKGHASFGETPAGIQAAEKPCGNIGLTCEDNQTCCSAGGNYWCCDSGTSCGSSAPNCV